MELWEKNAEGEATGNGVVDKSLIEYKNKWKQQHPQDWNRKNEDKGKRRQRRKWYLYKGRGSNHY